MATILDKIVIKPAVDVCLITLRESLKKQELKIDP